MGSKRASPKVYKIFIKGKNTFKINKSFAIHKWRNLDLQKKPSFTFKYFLKKKKNVIDLKMRSNHLYKKNQLFTRNFHESDGNFTIFLEKIVKFYFLDF